MVVVRNCSWQNKIHKKNKAMRLETTKKVHVEQSMIKQ